MLEELIERLFHTKEYTLKKMDKGLTNHNYLLTINTESYVIRWPLQDSAHIIDRKQENIVRKQVEALDVETLYFDEESGIKITRYVENAYTFAECPYEDKIERCAKMMKALHRIPAVSFSFHPFQTLETYKKHVKKPFYELTKYDAIIEEAKHFKNKPVLCHNDWVDGNMLFTSEREYLIDYEYAASNDPLFDVTSFLSENQIFDETLRNRFYDMYFDVRDEKVNRQLYIWEMFHNVLWCYWAMMMYESRQDQVYQKIAKDKYEALLNMEQGSYLLEKKKK